MELQHRSISIQSVRKLTQAIIENPEAAGTHPKGVNEPSQLEQLWSFVTSQSGITSSNAVNNIIALVHSGIISWNDALNNLTASLSTLSGVQLDSVIVGITDILIYQVDTETDSSLDYKCPFSGHGGTTHPYVLIMSTKTDESWLFLFTQIERIFDMSRLEFIKSKTSEKKSAFLRNMLIMIRPFLNFMILDGSQGKIEMQKYRSSALIHFLIQIVYQNVDDKDFNELREYTLKYLLSVIQKFPLTPIISHARYDITSGTVYLLLQSLVNIMEVPYVRNSFSSSFLKGFSNVLGIQILSIACDTHQSNLSTNHYMTLFYKILKIHYDFPNMVSLPSFTLLWPSLTFLLSDTHSCESQSIILKIMQTVIETNLNEDINPELISIAILPLFQAIADLAQDKTRSIAMETLLNVQKLHNIQRISNQKTLEEISKLSSLTFITGTLAELLSETHNLLNSFPISSDIFRIDNPKSPFIPLFHIPYLFHNKENIRIQALNAIISLINENILLAQSQKFSIFLLLLFILRNDISSSIHLHILHHSLPSLISPKDPIITTKVLKVTMGLIQDNKETRLEAVGIRVLYKLWERQRRCWRSLRFILSNWINNRKLNNSQTVDINSEKFEIEVAVLTTIRDICKSKIRNYTEEVLPFISSLLQSVILHPNSLCLIIESLNLCVEAEVIDPWAVWVVLMSYIADTVTKNKNLNVQLIARLCQFYQLVGQKDEDTDVYNEFKQGILSIYLCPLIFPNLFSNVPNQEEENDINSDLFQIQPNIQILKHGLQAIVQFQTKEILSGYLPKSPKILLAQILETKTTDLVEIEEWQIVLSKLISYDIETMRRGLFKGIATSGSTGNSGSENKDFLKINQKLNSIGSKIIDDWESGIVSPGLRVGFAFASLICFRPLIHKENEDKQLKSSRFYKLLINAIQDVTLTDHWIIRIGCVSEWFNFFVMGLQEVLPKTSRHIDIDIEENIVNCLMKDLMKQLIDARFPVICQNVILAITGLCLALKSLNVLSAPVHATKTLRYLLDNFFVDTTLTSKHQYKNQHQDSSLITSDEVQFGIIMALGYLSTIVITDEKIVRETIDTLVTKLSEIDESAMSGWTSFGAGFSLGTFLSCLSSSSIKTSEIAIICSETITFLADFLSSPLLSNNQSNIPQINSAFGVLLGLSNIDREDEEKAEQIYQKCLSDLKEFVNTGGKIDESIKSTIAGSAWFVGFSKGKEFNEEIVEIFEELIKIADTEHEWKEYYFHFSQVYSHVLLTILSTNQSSHYLSAFNAQVHLQIHILTSSNSSMVKRHAAIITLGSLLGVNYFSLPHLLQTTNSYFLTSPYLKMITQVLDILQNISGLGQQSSTSGMSMSDVKGGRLATVVLAYLMQTIERISEVGNGFAETFITSSTEPKDYSRLPITSYLRALFDGLVEISLKGNIADSQVSVEAGNLILKSFSNVNLMLPPVNWFSLLTRFNTTFFKKFNLHYQCVLLSIRNCNHSTSLMEFLVYILIGFPEILKDESSNMEYKKLLISEGLGKILELCGFENKTAKGDNQIKDINTKQRGIENIVRKVVVPNSRVSEIISGMVICLFSEKFVDPKIEELQINFLTTMSNYVTSTNMSNAPSAGALESLQQDIFDLLKNVYYGLPSPTSQTQTYIIRLAIQSCCNLNFTQYKNKDELKKYALTISTMSELGHIDAAKYLTQALEECLNFILEGSQSVDIMNPPLLFSWILHAIRVHILKFNGTDIAKKMKLDWLVRILDIIIIGTGTSRKDRSALEYRFKVALSGLVNLSWEEYPNELNQFNNSGEILPFKYYELWDERFENVMQNATSVGKLSSLIPRELVNSSKIKDNGIESVQKQILKRLLRLLDINREILIIDCEHHFILYSILTRLKEYIPNEEIWKLLDDDDLFNLKKLIK